MTKKKLIWFIPVAIVGTAAFVAVGGVVVRWLWNALLPPLFGWPMITFWQALGLLILCRILFGGFGGHGARRPSSRRRADERWEHMTPEERERLWQHLRERHGGTPNPGESQGS